MRDMPSLIERTRKHEDNQASSDRIRDYLTGKALFQEPAPLSHHLRRSMIDRAIFSEYPVDVDDMELLVGRYADEREFTAEQTQLMEDARKYINASGRLAGTFPAFTGHRVIDYELLLNTGIREILARIETYRAQIDFSRPEDAEKAAFYDAVSMSLKAFVRFCERARETLLSLAESEKMPVRREQLLRMARNFEKAPLDKCEHFYEAMQIMWFMQFALQLAGDTSLTGRMDNYLYPFYKKDIESGEITKDFAFDLICELYLKHNDIYHAWPASVMVGGVNRDGEPVWNELTEMCIEAIRATGLVNPSVNVSYTPDMPDSLMDKCLEIISEGYTRPAFFNDRVIQSGLRAAGMSERDSRYYIHSTCVEITPVGASNVQVATPYINLNKAYEYIFGGGKALYGAKCAVKPEIEFSLKDLKTFDDFRLLTEKVVRGIIRANLESTAQYLYTFSQYCSSPLASAFISDCLSRGQDSGAGGARYSYVYPCFPGFLNLVDALAAVRKAVYEDRVLTLEEMGALLKENFDGNERMRQYLLNRCPKIGNGLDEADQIGVELYNLIREELKNYTTSVGATFHPSYFAWIMHGLLGNEAAATPDGRRQGEALSECLGAVQGMDKNGPTGILRSIEKIDQKYGIGGIATNLRFSKKLMSSPEGREAVKNYIKTFMAHDCMEIQFNVVNQEDLLDALEHPEKHRSLLVRVAGYSDYFVNLTPVIQKEIIKRNEHDAI